MTKGKDQDEFFDDADYGSEEGEDFPEPAQPAKAKPNVALFAGAALGAIAIGLGGFYVAAPETLRDMLPADVVAMMPEGTFPAAEPEPTPEPVRPRKHHKAHQGAAPAPEAQAAAKTASPAQPADKVPADSAEWQNPSEPAQEAAADKPAKHAAKKPVEPVAKAPAAAKQAEAPAKPVKAAAKPAEKPAPAKAAAKPVEKPKPVKTAAKPVHKVASAGQAMASTAIAFAPHSYWVAAAEVEKLWAISARAGAHQGHFVLTTHVGLAADEAEMLSKRAEKLADMIRRNNVPSRPEVSIRSGAPAKGSTGWVDVSFVKRL